MHVFNLIQISPFHKQVIKGAAQHNLVRPCHGVIQDPVLPRHLDPEHNGIGSGVGGIVCVKKSSNPMAAKNVDADSRQALPGTCFIVLLLHWCKDGC